MTPDAEHIRAFVEDHIALVRQFVEEQAERMAGMADVLAAALQKGGRIFLFGNGGSAADAQHIAAEFINKMTRQRRPLAAVALTTDSSVLTSISNDLSFDVIFSRQLEALGAAGDVAIGITTSGNSPNVLQGIEKAAEIGMTTITLLGRGGGQLKGKADYEILVPGGDTPRIQEIHILAGHILCQLVEEKFVGENQRT